LKGRTVINIGFSFYGDFNYRDQILTQYITYLNTWEALSKAIIFIVSSWPSQSWVDSVDSLWKHSKNIQISDVFCYKLIPMLKKSLLQSCKKPLSRVWVREKFSDLLEIKYSGIYWFNRELKTVRMEFIAKPSFTQFAKKIITQILLSIYSTQSWDSTQIAKFYKAVYVQLYTLYNQTTQSLDL